MTTDYERRLDNIKIGDRVWGTHSDNFGFTGTIIGMREVPLNKLPYRFRVRFDDNGQECWIADWEINGVGEEPS